MAKPLVLLLLASMLAPAVATAGRPSESAHLANEHRAWIDEDVAYIASEVERRAFVGLPTAAARDRFIEEFWLARDPTPGTEKNERRLEHAERIGEANRLFGGRKRPGWKSPRGKLFIQLGPPKDRMRYDGHEEIYPIELWLYHGHRDVELPRFFQVMFFKPYGAGEFELYDPVADGPDKLVGGLFQDAGSRAATGGLAGIANANVDGLFGGSGAGAAQPLVMQDDRARALSVLRRIDPTLAAASLSLDLFDRPDLEAGIAQPAAIQLAHRLETLSDRQPVDLAYVARVVEGSPSVEVEYSFRNLGLVAHFHGAFDSPQGGLLHYAVEIPPGNLEVQRFGRETTAAVEVVGRVFDATTGLAVLQIEERAEVALTAAQLAEVRRFPFAFEDVVALIPGSYRVNLLVRNLVSKEVGVVEGKFEIPAAASDRPTLAPVLIVSRRRTVATGGSPAFRFAGDRLYPAHAALLSTRGELDAMVQIAYPTGRFRRGDELAVVYDLVGIDGRVVVAGRRAVRLDPATDGGIVIARIQAPLAGHAAGPCVLRVSIESGDGEPIERRTPVVLVDEPPPPPPWIYANDRDVRASFRALSLGEQYLGRDDESSALAAFEAAAADVSGDPAVLAAARIHLAEIRLHRHEYDRARDAVRPLTVEPTSSSYALFLLGLSHSGGGDSAGAIQAYRRASEGSPESTEILNVLGEEWLRAGNEAEATASFRRSLELDADQSRIRDLMPQPR